ncbi:protein GOLM2 [Paramormyrops kingsleyae]|uniref:Protein GOLM2 n=1 Tax=Paramormyrops kingsleyae TaxID=1676925 RepID=A0A3B3T1N1_9TELE|nr:protein CASC4 [Paramormyrops kingsleyae]
MVGFGANRRGGRLPSLILVALMVVILILSFNYWAVSSKHGRLLDELAEVQTQVKRTDAARSRLEKRNSELMAQVDTHRKQIDQREVDVGALEGKLQTRDAQVKKCADEKMKLQNDGTIQATEMQRLRDQLRDLQQEFQKQEEQLHETKRNSTQLEKRLEYESFQCGRQIAQLKEEYEERIKILEQEAAKLRRNLLQNHETGKLSAREDEGAATGNRHEEAEMKGDMAKPGSDAGMPGIEDSEVGKADNLDFAPKKPAITQKHIPVSEVGADVGEGAEPAQDVSQERHDHPGDNALDLAGLEQHSPGNEGAGLQPLQAVADQPVVFDQDNKASVRADELGEHHGQIKAPDDVQGDGRDLRGAWHALPPNAVQAMPNPMDPQLQGRESPPAEPVRHRQSRFFDENESPADPQHGSKLADYNGDDGNVGEYEADKQAELAYNEEEDGDGGEEDVQDDEDRELQGDRIVGYGKRHQGADIL